MLHLKKIISYILRIYFVVYLLLVPVLISFSLRNLSDYESKLISDLTFDALAADVSTNFNLNQNLCAKQIRTLFEIRIKLNRSDLQYAEVFYQVLIRIYSKKHHYNFNSIVPAASTENFSTISRSPPFLPYYL